MARKSRVRKQVRKFIKAHSMLWVDYSNWYIGVTHEPERRLGAHKRRLRKPIRTHQYWKVRTARDAADVERFFLDKGMKGSYGGWGKQSRYVYIIKERGPYS